MEFLVRTGLTGEKWLRFRPFELLKLRHPAYLRLVTVVEFTPCKRPSKGPRFPKRLRLHLHADADGMTCPESDVGLFDP